MTTLLRPLYVCATLVLSITLAAASFVRSSTVRATGYAEPQRNLSTPVPDAAAFDNALTAPASSSNRLAITASSTYTLTILGEGVRPTAINDQGTVVGTYGLDPTTGASAGGFLWQTDRPTSTITTGANRIDIGYPTKINEAGQVVGMTGDQAVLWEQGKTIALGAGIATSINNAGQVVIAAYNAVSARPAAPSRIWHNGTTTSLGSVTATDINDAGQVTGEVSDRAFIWQNGRSRGLETNAARSRGTAINKSGQVAGHGSFFGVDAERMGFLWSAGRLTYLGLDHSSDSDEYNTIYDVNDAGQVIGVEEMRPSAFLWQGGVLSSLDSLVQGAVRVTIPTAINNRGQIVGIGQHPITRRSVGFVLTPVANISLSPLYATVGSRPGEVSLTWKAPEVEPSGRASRYDIRYSPSKITLQTWHQATPVQGLQDRTPAAPGITETLTLAPGTFQTGKRWYFAMKAANHVGVWSNLSNVPSIQDSSFRPAPDGYAFRNFAGTPNDFTMIELRRMLGDQAVCVWVGQQCVPKFSARTKLREIQTGMAGGVCDGVAATSLRFFKGMDTEVLAKQGELAPYWLAETQEVRRHIAYYWAMNFFEPLQTFAASNLNPPLTDLLNQLQHRLSGAVVNPPTLRIYGNRTSGHSLTPYALEQVSQGRWRIRVYDPNWPYDPTQRATAHRSILIDTAANTWSYDFGGATWTSNPQSLIGLVPVSVYGLPMTCPSCLVQPSNNLRERHEVWLAGPGHLRISDRQGQQIGFAGERFIDEIPGAQAHMIPGGLGVPTEPIYSLPLTDTYRILIDGRDVTRTETVRLAQFGPDYAVSIDGIAVSPPSQDQLAVAPDGTYVTYQATTSQAPTFSLALDGASESQQFRLGGVDLEEGKAITATVRVATGQFVVNNARGSSGAYAIELEQVTSIGQRHFRHADVPMTAGDTHYLEYQSWNGSGPMSLGIDHGSDGTIDKTVLLENEGTRVFLPLVMK